MNNQRAFRLKIFRLFPLLVRVFLLLLITHYLFLIASAQKIAFLIPEKNTTNQTVAEKLKENLSPDFKFLDDSLAESVMLGVTSKNLFNLSKEEAQNLGRAIGCDFFIIQKAETLRRASLSKPDYYESYTVNYLISSQTGNMVFWKLLNAEGKSAVEAEKALFDSINNLASEISVNIKSARQKEFDESKPANLTELPSDESPESKKFRSPLPYRRMKPEYTSLANLYNVAATVDALVDLDENGKILRVEITRWAGYGLDESVIETIKKMQWRAAEYSGKPLPIRVLLRYNFKKLKSDANTQ